MCRLLHRLGRRRRRMERWQPGGRVEREASGLRDEKRYPARRPSPHVPRPRFLHVKHTHTNTHSPVTPASAGRPAACVTRAGRAPQRAQKPRALLQRHSGRRRRWRRSLSACMQEQHALVCAARRGSGRRRAGWPRVRAWRSRASARRPQGLVSSSRRWRKRDSTYAHTRHAGHMAVFVGGESGGAAVWRAQMQRVKKKKKLTND